MTTTIKEFDYYKGLIDRTSAEDSAARIAGALDRQGWAIVRIPRIGAGEPLIIAYEKHIQGMPAGYAVYTAAELERIESIEDPWMLVMVHAAEKIGGTLLTEVEK